MARISAKTREKVRRRLLETAAEHFAERGLDGAQIDAIAQAAGYAKGTVYNYFDTKEQLFAEVLAEGCRSAVQRYAASAHEGGVRECLRALAAADVAVLREEEGFMRVVVREAMGFNPRTYPTIIEHMAPYVVQVQQVLERGLAAGEIRDDRPVGQLALVFIGFQVLLFVQHWGSGGAWPSLEEIPDLAVSLFLDGAATRNPQP
ncbi:MAG TPA: TetR/AcrR family transcriptional regulator [Myxococcota bacterium]|nr:TetR/AcrR family transcriptional regulator [Myxococcota bacterium]